MNLESKRLQELRWADDYPNRPDLELCKSKRPIHIHERLAIPITAVQRRRITTRPQKAFPFLAMLLAYIPRCLTRLCRVLLLRPLQSRRLG